MCLVEEGLYVVRQSNVKVIVHVSGGGRSVSSRTVKQQGYRACVWWRKVCK
jgi:hypothetical protein